MNRMNYLAQLALMLRGSGMGNQYGPSDDLNAPTSNAGSASYGSIPGSDLPVTPAQEFMLGTTPYEIFGSRPMAIPRPMPFPFPFPGEWSDPIPRWSPFTPPRVIPAQPRFPIPYDVPLPPPFPVPRKKRRDDMMGEPDDGSSQAPTFPPYNSPFPIPDAASGGGPVLPPITDPIPPYNPPLEIPKRGIWDDLNRLEPGEPTSEIPEEEECEEEWDDALNRCTKEYMRLRKMRTGEHIWFDMNRCTKKFVSERCGGNPVDWGPKGKPPAPDEPDPAGFI